MIAQDFYRPQPKFGARWCFYTCLILFTGRGCTPLGRHPPPADTPPPETATKTAGMHPTGMYSYYRPQTKFVKVMILHVSVCPRRGELSGLAPDPHLGGKLRGLAEGGCLSQCMLGCTPHSTHPRTRGRHPAPTRGSPSPGDTGNKRTVHILLERILVFNVNIKHWVL